MRLRAIDAKHDGDTRRAHLSDQVVQAGEPWLGR